MSVLSRSFKQTNGYFVPLGNCQGKVYSYTGSVGAGGDSKVGGFSQAAWAIPAVPNVTSTTAILVSTLLVGPATGGVVGGLFKDMGKTVVSASRTFRKVQLVVPGLSSSGVAQVSGDSTYLSGYIELAGAGGFAGGLGNSAAGQLGVAPVAYLPGLM